MKRKQKAFCPLNEIVNPDICCLSQTLAWNAWQVGLCYNDKLIHIILWSWPEIFFDINFQELHFENENSLKCLQFLTTQQSPLALPRVSTSKKKKRGEGELGSCSSCYKEAEAGGHAVCMVKTQQKGAVLLTWGWCCGDGLSPSFSLALSPGHVMCQTQMKIERIQLKIELNSISPPNSEGAFGNTVRSSSRLPLDYSCPRLKMHNDAN